MPETTADNRTWWEMHRLRIKRVLILFLAAATMVVGFNNCDGIKTPSVSRTMMSVSFNHEGITANCNSCHAAGKTFASYPASGHMDTSGQDCVACHNVFSWHSGTSPHGAGQPPPTTCISCHSAARPMTIVGSAGLVNNLTPVGGLFDHTLPVGQGDCVTCHSANAANIGVSWADAVFAHPTNLTTCMNCHTAAQRPTGPVGNNPVFNHDIDSGGRGDCVSCHNRPENLGRTWQQAKFGHSPTPAACMSCHASDPGYTAIQNVVKNQMVHVFPGMPDCVRCHAGPSMAGQWTSWVAQVGVTNGVYTPRATLGVFHSNFGSTPSSCTTCHTNERPKVPVGASGFNHGTSGQGECASCHLAVPANVGRTWTGGTIAHNGFTACASCHAADKPAGVVPNTRSGFDHAAKYGTECFSCHTVVKANVGVSWARGFFNHNNNNAASFANCSPCHSTRQSKADHSRDCGGDPYCANRRCTDCHNVRWPAPNANGNYGGSFD